MGVRVFKVKNDQEIVVRVNEGEQVSPNILCRV